MLIRIILIAVIVVLALAGLYALVATKGKSIEPQGERETSHEATIPPEVLVKMQSATPKVVLRPYRSEMVNMVREHAIETLTPLGFDERIITCVLDRESYGGDPAAYNQHDTDGKEKFTQWQYDTETWAVGEKNFEVDLDITNWKDANIMTSLFWSAGQTGRWPSFKKCS